MWSTLPREDFQSLILVSRDPGNANTRRTAERFA